MDARTILFIVGISGTLALCAINFYLVRQVQRLEQENKRLQPPF